MFHFKDIVTYHEELISGTTSCTEAIDFYLNNIEQKISLNAIVEVYKEEAIGKAAFLDDARKKDLPLKKLHGVVIAIKDVICYKEHSLGAASKMLKGFTSRFTATALQYLIDEDAIIIGNCNCDEFAMGSSNEYSAYGPVLNAANTAHVPGGSSGGSAVAVQADLCMVSLGSDTGGSVRQPADHCGIIGLKPSYGRISRFGLIAYASSFDQIGIFGRYMADVRLLLEVMSRPDEMDSTMMKHQIEPENSKKDKLKFCVFTEALRHPKLDEEIRNNIFNTIQQLKENGHTVEEIPFPLIDYIVPTYYVLTTAESSSNLSRYDGVRYGYRSEKITDDIQKFYKQNRSEGFGMEVKRRIMMGNFVLSTGYHDAYYGKAQKLRRLLCNLTDEIFANFDAIMMPVTTTTAPLLGTRNEDGTAVYLADIFTVFANLTGIPAIAIPMFSHSNNMPFGLQLMSKKDNELSLLFIANLVQHYKTG